MNAFLHWWQILFSAAGEAAAPQVTQIAAPAQSQQKVQMTVSVEDQFMATLMAYREAAGSGDAQLTAVLCVARNNAIRHKTSFFAEVTKAFRYSSINCPVNVADYIKKNKLTELQQIINALGKYPSDTNTVEWTAWKHIAAIVAGILSGATEDITNGATLYYATNMMDFPKNWDASKVVFTVQIGAQRFYREL